MADIDNANRRKLREQLERRVQTLERTFSAPSQSFGVGGEAVIGGNPRELRLEKWPAFLANFRTDHPLLSFREAQKVAGRQWKLFKDSIKFPYYTVDLPQRADVEPTAGQRPDNVLGAIPTQQQLSDERIKRKLDDIIQSAGEGVDTSGMTTAEFDTHVDKMLAKRNQPRTSADLRPKKTISGGKKETPQKNSQPSLLRKYIKNKIATMGKTRVSDILREFL